MSITINCDPTEVIKDYTTNLKVTITVDAPNEIQMITWDPKTLPGTVTTPSPGETNPILICDSPFSSATSMLSVRCSKRVGGYSIKITVTYCNSHEPDKIIYPLKVKPNPLRRR